jgi:hypothetical protein
VAYDDYVVDDPDWHGSRDLLCRRVTVSGQVLDTAGVLLSYAANGQMEADVASDGQDFFSVWTDLRSGSRGHDCAVYGLRFSAEGEVLDPTGFRISQWKSHAPSIAYGADCHLVAWLTDRGEDSCDVWARRISREGVPLDAGPIRLPSASTWSCYSFPDVAYGDSIFLVVWYECNGRTRGARVAADGVLLDTVPLQLDLGNLSGSVPQVVSDGHDFLVAMIEKWFPSPVYAMRVGSNGQLLDTTEIILGRSGTIFDLPIPQVAFGAGVYLVTEPVHSKAWRVTPAGVVLDSVIHPSGGFTMWPNVGYDGTNFLLAGAGTGGFDARGLYGRRISPGGVLLDSVRFTLIDLSNEPTYLPYMGTRLISNSLGIVGLVMTTFESDPYVSTRVRVSVFPAVTGATCEPATAGRQKKPSATIVNRAKPFVTTEPAALLDITGRKLLGVCRNTPARRARPTTC